MNQLTRMILHFSRSQMKTSSALFPLSRHPVFWMFALRPENFIQSHVMSNSIELNAISMVWITQQPRLPGSKMTLLWKWDYDHQVKKIWPTHKKTTLLFWKSTWHFEILKFWNFENPPDNIWWPDPAVSLVCKVRPKSTSNFFRTNCWAFFSR